MVKKVPLLSLRAVVITFVRPIYLVEIFQTSIKSLNSKGETNNWSKTSKYNALSNGTMHGCILGVPPLTFNSEMF